MPGPRGAACSTTRACADGLACLTGLHAFGGYCASTGCDACDGACVGTPRGELCMARCERDTDCRADEGYVCDAAWHACVMPNTTAIVPRTCPAARGIGRDPQFAPTATIADASESSAALAPGGGLVIAHATEGAIAITRLDVHGRATPGPTLGPGAHPFVARAGGAVYAAWTAPSGLVIAHSPDGAAWSEPRAIAPCTDCRATVVGAGAAVHVVFADEGLRVRTSRDGGTTFGPAAVLLPGASGDAAIGADGRLHAVAIDGGPLGAFGSANQHIVYTAAGGKPITVSRRDELLPFYFAIPSIAVDSRRKWLYIAYVRGGRDAVWELVLAASKDAGKTWTRRTIGDGCAIHMVPTLALDTTTGALHVTWYDSRGEHPRFAHAACTPGLARCTQLGRINDTPLATLTTVRHAASWIGDRETLLVDAERRTLHAVWAQPVAGAGRARVFHAKAKLPLR